LNIFAILHSGQFGCGTIMFRRSLLFACALNCAAIPAALAQDTVHWGNVGPWQIRIDKSVNYGCFLLGSYTQGTVVRIGFDQNNRNGYIMVGNEAWHSLQVGGRYELVLRFDNAAPWRGRATARRIGSGSMVFLYLSFDSPRFLVEWARRVNLRIFYAGNLVTTLPLRGTNAATQELLRCQRAADDARIDAPPADPFGGGPQTPSPGTGGPGPNGPQPGPSAPQPGPSGPQPGPSGPSPGPSGPSSGPSGPSSGPSGPTFGPSSPSSGPSGGGPSSGPSGGGPSPGPSGPTFSPSGPRSPGQ
jgi:hypothetical protein